MTIKKLKSYKLNDFKLVVASVCAANVGQLTADLLVNSLNMEKFALFNHIGIIPLLGPSAFDESDKEISTASEFFVCQNNKIVLLLIRSPITAHYLQSLCDEIIIFVKSEGIAEIIQLSSAYSYEQHYVQQSPFEFVASESFNITELLLSNFNKSESMKVPGSGIAMKLHEAALRVVPSIVLFKYVSEGDNTFDALQFASKFNKLLNHPINEKDGKVDLKIPISWKYMFGNTVNTEIY